MSQETTSEGIVEAQVPDAEGTDIPDDDSQANLLTIDSTKLDFEIQRLQRENKEFANAFNRAVGNKAARQYKPRIQELENLLNLNQREIKRMSYANLPAEEVERRFNSDAAFARDYAEIAHSSPDEYQQMAVAASYRSLITETITDAIDEGLSEVQANSLLEGIAKGKYNDRGSIPAQLQAFQRDVMRAVLDVAKPQPVRQPKPKVEPVEEEEEPATPPPPGPEMSRGTPSRASGARPRFRTATEAAALFAEGRITAAEYRQAKQNLEW